jgi:hypothetical protein
MIKITERELLHIIILLFYDAFEWVVSRPLRTKSKPPAILLAHSLARTRFAHFAGWKRGEAHTFIPVLVPTRIAIPRHSQTLFTALT